MVKFDWKNPVSYVNPVASFGTGAAKGAWDSVSKGMGLGGGKPAGAQGGNISPQQLEAAGQQGLQLGQTITGQDINQTGTQIQDLLQKQLALTNQGGSNPITAAMQANKAQAVSATNQDLARAGVKGGAAAAARLQTSSKMDRDIAAEAFRQHQDALQNSRQMMGGIASAQLAPKFQEQQMAIAANAPVYQPQQPGAFGQLFQGLF